MGNKFTLDEIREAVRTARIYSPGLTEEQFEGMIELQKHLGEPGYFEATCGLARLEKERGICCTEALDNYEQLLRDTAKLEQKIAGHRAKLEQKVAGHRAELETLEGKISQAQEKLQHLEEAMAQARKELEEVKAEREGVAKELIAFKKRAEREKQHIDEELEAYQREANVTREEIAGTTQLKGQLASRGFTIEFTLDLCQELVGHENAREELARAIKEHGTLTKANAALAEQGKTQKEALELRQAKVKTLEETRHQLETVISQLQADVAYEEELRRFYNRYKGASVLMDQLATWRNIFFVRCNNPLYALTGAFDRSSSCAHFWTEKPPVRRCPCCDYPGAAYDEKLYQALNQPVGTPLQLKLGE